MGRYDFPSEGSRSGFFSNRVMYAALNCVGNTPDDSDLLNSSVMNGANTSTLSLRTCIGSGSVAHCLADDKVVYQGMKRATRLASDNR